MPSLKSARATPDHLGAPSRSPRSGAWGALMGIQPSCPAGGGGWPGCWGADRLFGPGLQGRTEVPDLPGRNAAAAAVPSPAVGLAARPGRPVWSGGRRQAASSCWAVSYCRTVDRPSPFAPRHELASHWRMGRQSERRSEPVPRIHPYLHLNSGRPRMGKIHSDELHA